MADRLELDEALQEAEIRLERLRSLYEQYFLGLEKIEPAVARKDLDRRLWTLRREKINNTARRFKLQNIVQRYNTFQQYWQRICREIENGTYKRHVQRAERSGGPQKLLTIATRRRFGLRAPAENAATTATTTTVNPAPEAPVAGESPATKAPPKLKPPPKRLAPGREPGAKSAAPGPKTPVPAAARAQPKKAAAGATADSSLSAARIRELHSALVDVKRGLNDTGKVSVQGLAKTLRTAESRLKEQHAGRKVDFDVVVKDGKAILKPRLR